MDQNLRLKFFPVSFFSVILGLSGLTIITQKLESIYSFENITSAIFLILTTAIFTVLSITYAIKLIKFPNEVKMEFHHPIKISFFPAFSISFILLSIATLSVNKDLSSVLWHIGTVLHFVLTIAIISRWIHHPEFKIIHNNPAWFIPAVGNILVPVAGTTHAPEEISWFFFSIGLFFWIILLVIFFNRIIFHSPLPDKLLPTMFILIAPPAVGLISYVKLTGEIDAFGKILYFFAMFLVILLLSQFRMFKRIKFFLSWWAYSFPIAAFSLASVLMYHETGTDAYKYIATAMAVMLISLIAYLIFSTFRLMLKKEICIEE